jgi:hypothetical protein
MSLQWRDDTQWIEAAMDEYHATIRAERMGKHKRNWKFSDLNPTLQSIMLRRAEELRREAAKEKVTQGTPLQQSIRGEF